MKIERNEFQRLVDHQMGNMEWTPGHSRAVLRKLRQGKPAPRRYFIRYALSFAMAAIAVFLIAFSMMHRQAVPDMAVATQPVMQTIQPPAVTPVSRAEAVRLARQAVMEKYGLTLQTLGVFRDDCQLTETGWVVRFFTSNQINSRLAGEYTVTMENGFTSAVWTHDHVDKSIYADGSLNRVAWGHWQLLYAITDGAREAFAINMELNAEDGRNIDYSYIEGTELWGDLLTETKASSGDITADAAAALACEAFEQQFDISVDKLNETAREAFIIVLNGTLCESASGIRVWVFTPSFEYEGDCYYAAIYINARTGELERLEYTTLGNG